MSHTLEFWADKLKSGQSTNSRLVLDLPECRIELRTNCPELVTKLRLYFRDVVASDESSPYDIHIEAIEGPAEDLPLAFAERPPEAGKQKIKEEFVEFSSGRIVRKRLTGMLFLFGKGRQIAYGPCLANDNQVVNFINSRYLQYQVDRKALLCHAAGVAVGDRGLALAGLAGRGKSTLALHILSLGADFVSNDRLLIRRQEKLRMLGIPKLPRVNPGTVLHNRHLASVMPPSAREEVSRLPSERLWSLEQKYDVFLDDCFGPGRFRLAAEQQALVMLTWERGSKPFELRRVEMTQRSDLLDAFRKSLGLFTSGDDDDLGGDECTAADYLNALGDCPVYEFTGGVDFDTAARICRRFLQDGEMSQAGGP